jgi:hypothetical protein
VIFSLNQNVMNDFLSNISVLLVRVVTFQHNICRRPVGASRMSQNVIFGKKTTLERGKYLGLLEN